MFPTLDPLLHSELRLAVISLQGQEALHPLSHHPHWSESLRGLCEGTEELSQGQEVGRHITLKIIKLHWPFLLDNKIIITFV